MINLIENNKSAVVLDESGANLPMALQEDFVIGVYASLDEAIACELARLCCEESIVPSCKAGCCYCCRHHILTSIAEAHTLAQYIRREFSAEQINDLRLRTQQWHEWDNAKPGRYPSSILHDGQDDLSSCAHSCPLDVNGVCGAYPVRPVVCRTHLVCSSPLSCRAANDPDSGADAPEMLRSVVMAASPFFMAIKVQIESAGLDFSRSIMLLPQWLALEMGWDFSISDEH
ncbi:MAG: hypothetical protein A2505_08855 [Deltaproteobacteria bacterium RIFOXYD12_FULL_55_16]|nr:MAG: hypothetical protein A2505_08855 [Deltaproteobacteria bacterium RIFOXYD12_FULL_55_16]